MTIIGKIFVKTVNKIRIIETLRTKNAQINGEGIDIDEQLKQETSSLAKAVSWANIMMYDVPPSDLGAPKNKLTLDNYKQVLTYFQNYMPKNMVVMGFEPGG